MSHNRIVRVHASFRNMASQLSKHNARYKALLRELNPRTTQAESSHDPLYRDIKSNLTVASRAEKVFKAGIPLNRRGERNVPKRYHKVATYTPDGDEQGYFVYHNGAFTPVEFDFTHCSGTLSSITTRKVAGNPINSPLHHTVWTF